MDNKLTTESVFTTTSGLPLKGKIDFQRISDLSDTLRNLVERIKSQAFLPSGAKVAPSFTLPQLADLCKVSRSSMLYKLAKAEELGLSAGSISHAADPENTGESSTSKRKTWTLAEARAWISSCSIAYKRPQGVPGNVITVANFKGGVGKTVTSMTLAQGLTLMGYKVLAIDADPQGSLTSLFGILPTQVSDDMTILPLMLPPKSPGARSTIKESIRNTYWDGLDLVCSAPGLFSGEFYLPTRQLNNEESNFNFHQILNIALDDGTRHAYDYIIIDTMPALSYLTMNTLWAADSVVMPLPPEGLDIVSSAQFWSMFTELAESMPNEKSFNFIGILPSKVSYSKTHTKPLLRWIQAGYGELLLPVEIPDTQVVNVGTTELRTVYDITKYVGATKTYARARDAYDKLVTEIDHLTRTTCWDCA